jgi:hypothetical protein
MPRVGGPDRGGETGSQRLGRGTPLFQHETACFKLKHPASEPLGNTYVSWQYSSFRAS